jgi:D-alanyl-D-alanine carboxypeptidase-like protein
VRDRALLAGTAAFIAVLVTGSLLVAILRRADAGPGDSSSSVPAGTPSPRPEPKPRIDAYLAWVPGGLPATFASRASSLAGIERVTAVAEDNVWMTASYAKNGALVDRPRAPYMVPIDAAGIDAIFYSAFLPPEAQSLVAGLADGQALLGETSARLRDLGPGGIMEFEGGARVEIAGILPDALVGGAEVVVNRTTGEAIGILRDRYLLLRPAPGRHPPASQLRERLLRLLPPDLSYRTVRVRAPGQARFLRMGDAVLPPVLIKARFGEWIGRPDPTDPGTIEVDPNWVERRIVTVTVPVLGEVTCHEKLIPQLQGAMTDIERTGLADAVQSYAGCFTARFVLGSPTATISHHSWGIAVDINADSNPFGAVPQQDAELVEVMERWGFIWGGRFTVPDGHHFEYVQPPPKS